MTQHGKAFLPSKVCQACGRSFTWRKKWARVWDDVRYCSERCRRVRRPEPVQSGQNTFGKPFR
ncbi:DUF2256 domain-containing protein [Pandoraea soli]